jgi:ABC-2 type transport system ATP-binding protein
MREQVKGGTVSGILPHEKILDIGDHHASLPNGSTTGSIISPMLPALRVSGLHKYYSDGIHALRGLSLEVPAGSFFGLLGPNGAGKTTLIGSIVGLVRAAPGQIFVFGHDAVADAASARMLVGLAPQEVHLDRFLTTTEVLTYHARYFGLSRSEAEERAQELLDAFDLTGKARTRPDRLSGGMRRRLLIARALAHRPLLLILDEPTAGIDLELRHELWRFLRSLHREQQTTVLLTTHYLEEAEELCERVAFIRDGLIVAEGETRELVQTEAGRRRLEDAYLEVMR